MMTKRRITDQPLRREDLSPLPAVVLIGLALVVLLVALALVS